MFSELIERAMGSPARPVRLVKEAIEKLGLDLSGLVVLTEAASGNYVYTPLICACAGCERILAFTRDSAYGPADAVARDTVEEAQKFGVAGRINIVTGITDDMWASADIVTNLAFLRPIDATVVAKLKGTAAVPLMFETWEYREADLDLRACWERGVTVLGTNEEHGAIKILDYLGMLVAEKLLEQGVEVVGSRLVVLGRGKFFVKVSSALERMGSFVVRWLADVDERQGGSGVGERLEVLRGADAIVIADEPVSTRTLVGAGGLIGTSELASYCPDAVIVQLAGIVDREELAVAGVRCLPPEPPAPGHMGWSLSDLGPKTVIDLHAAGLRVGELLTRARLGGLGPAAAVAEALRNPICQDFSPEQKRVFGWRAS